jgi:DNA repair exonuclease SbcCD ATPase subunit
VDADTKREIDRIEKRLDEVEDALKRAKSDMQGEVTAGFDGVRRHLSIAIPAAVTASVEPTLNVLRGEIKRLADAETSREKRKKTELEQEAEKLSQEERRLALEERRQDIEAKRIANASGRHAVLEQPFETRFTRKMRVAAVITTLVVALVGGLGTCTAFSHQ